MIKFREIIMRDRVRGNIKSVKHRVYESLRDN